MDPVDDDLSRAQRRFETDRAGGQVELERAQQEFDQAKRTITDVLIDWTARGSHVALELRGGQRVDGLVIAVASDHVTIDDDRRGEVLVRTGSIELASEVAGSVPRRANSTEVTMLAVLRSAVAMERTVTVWRAIGGPQHAVVSAVSGDHLLGRVDRLEIAWRLDSLDVVSVASGSLTP